MIAEVSLQLLERLHQQRVLIVGDVMLDEYLWGEVSRISPEAPVPVVNILRRTYRPGGASNVAASIAALGSTPLLGGVVGDDAMATTLRTALDANAIANTSGLVAVAERPTTVKSRIIAHNQQMLRCDVEVTSPIDPDTEELLLAWFDQNISSATVCVLSDYAKGVLTERVCQHVLFAARRRGIPAVVDPKGVRYERYAGATAITPNLSEAVTATHTPIKTPADIAQAAHQLLALLDGGAVIITRGADGMVLFQPNAAPLFIPAQARAVYDVTGAGDTVVALLALALGAGAPLTTAIELATVAAGIVVGKIGTATVSSDELRRSLLHPFNEI